MCSTPTKKFSKLLCVQRKGRHKGVLGEYPCWKLDHGKLSWLITSAPIENFQGWDDKNGGVGGENTGKKFLFTKVCVTGWKNIFFIDSSW